MGPRAGNVAARLGRSKCPKSSRRENFDSESEEPHKAEDSPPQYLGPSHQAGRERARPSQRRAMAARPIQGVVASPRERELVRESSPVGATPLRLSGNVGRAESEVICGSSFNERDSDTLASSSQRLIEMSRGASIPIRTLSPRISTTVMTICSSITMLSSFFLERTNMASLPDCRREQSPIDLTTFSISDGRADLLRNCQAL